MKKLFSLITLVGVLAACQPETIETTFDPDPAKVYITVVATEILTGNDVTSKVKLSADKPGSWNDNVFYMEGNPSITATTVTFSAVYNDETYNASVSIRTIAAAGRADYAVNVIVGKIAPSPTNLEAVEGEAKITKTVNTLKNASHNGEFSHDGHSTGIGHSITHNGSVVDTWMLNNTEMLLDLYTTYTKIIGKKCDVDIDFSKEPTEIELEYINMTIKALENPAVKTTPEKYKFKVSAWAYYNVMQTVTLSLTPVTVNRIYADKSKEAIATIYLSDYSSDIVSYEFASNTHYAAGHGHGHSTHDEHGSENAGGGIVWAD